MKKVKDNFRKKLKEIDEKVGDFEDNAIPKVTIEKDWYEDFDYDYDMRCTDYGDAMDFFD